MRAPLQQVAEPLRLALEAEVSRAVGEAVALAPFAAHAGVADETLKLAARAGNRVLGVVLCAPEIAPRLIARGCERGRAARAALGEALGAAVVTASAEGESAGRSWALFPQARVLGRGPGASLERRWLAGAVARWLRGVAERTRGPADDAARERFERALACAEREPALAESVRVAARAARAALASGAWRPRHTLMHGDLWAGNVLGAPGASRLSRRFVVIDWDTSRTEGYAFYDLVRAASSFRFSLRREIAAHCALLGIGPAEARFTLAAALGHLGLERESYSLARYAEMCGSVLATFDAAV